VATAKKYTLEGKETGTVEIDDTWIGAGANPQLIKDYIVAIRANARQWSANTKGRSEVSHSNQKPHKQKGTGKARAGSLASPQFKGGGVVFGPKPKFDQHVRINQKERQAALRQLIGDKIRNEKFLVLEEPKLTEPKTKPVAQFVKGLGLQRRTLFLGSFASGDADGTQVTVKSTEHQNLKRSVSNIPKSTFSLVNGISGYDVAVAETIVITEPALKQLIDWLQPKSKKVA
jgi:large subunit ribosomal protein L4